MIKVSVIVPAYNYGHLLPRCLDHLVNQSLKDIEIIIVDDCSTDNTTEVVKPYLKDSRVKYVRNEVNKKLYTSRIVGMKIAQGAYIAHCDADDYYEHRAFELMYNEALASGADIVVAEFIQNNETWPMPSNCPLIEGFSPLMHFLSNEKDWSLYNKIYKKHLIDFYLQNAPEISLTHTEDFLANFIIHSFTQKKSYLSIPLYWYIKNTESVSRKLTPPKILQIMEEIDLSRTSVFQYIDQSGLENPTKIKKLVDNRLVIPNAYMVAEFLYENQAMEIMSQAPEIFKDKLIYALAPKLFDKEKIFQSMGIKSSMVCLAKALLRKIKSRVSK